MYLKFIRTIKKDMDQICLPLFQEINIIYRCKNKFIEKSRIITKNIKFSEKLKIE